jgi:phosphoserine phosphatase
MIKWVKQDHIYEGKKGSFRFFILTRVNKEKKKEEAMSLYILNGEKKEKFVGKGESVNDFKLFAESFRGVF